MRADTLIQGENSVIKKVILVFKTHFDIGFTDLSKNVIDNYSTDMLDQVLETCEATADMGEHRYIWTMPSWPLKQMLTHCSQERKVRLEKLIESGQIVWHALAYTSHFDFCGPEEYRYGFTYARELSDTYKKPFPISAKMTDVPGHGRGIVPLLAEQGVKFLHLGCNEFIRPPKVPELFFWEGPDGSRVLTMYNKGYGSQENAPEDWPYSVWMALMHTHDNCGPQSANAIREMAARIQKQYPQAQVVCGTMDDFFRELEKEDLSAVPVVQKDLADTWIHGVGTYPREVKRIRSARRRLKQLKKRFQKAEGRMAPADREKAIALMDECQDQMMIFGEHTWGIDVKTWLNAPRVYQESLFQEERKKPDYRKLEDSWKEQSDRAWRAWKACRELEDLLPAEEACCGGQKAWPAEQRGASRQENTLRQETLVSSEEDRGLGQEEQLEQQGNGVIENACYRILLDEASGQVEEIYDKTAGQTILRGREGHPAVCYQYDRYGAEDLTKYLRKAARRYSDWGILDNGKDSYPECTHITACPRFQRYELEGKWLHLYYQNETDEETYGNPKNVILSLGFAREKVEIFLTLKGKKASPYTESGSLVLELPMEAPGYGVNKNGYVLNPKTDIADWGNHALYCLENFVTAEEGERKLCVAALDTPLLGIGETGIYKFRKKYKKKRPALYFNLFNNMWGTNFPQWIEGDFSFRFVLFDVKKELGKALVQTAEEKAWEMEIEDLPEN